MISMLITDSDGQEVQYLSSFTREFAGTFTEEKWVIHTCCEQKELEEFLEKQEPLDFICLDITGEDFLTKMFDIRRLYPNAYLLLIADTSISPLKYLRPQIKAASLMIKPLTKKQIGEVMTEALEEFMKEFMDSKDKEKVFIIENKEGRILTDFQKINYFESREKKVFMNTPSREIGFYDTLEQLEEKLSEDFIRCHRSYLVNKKKISEILLSQNLLILQGNIEIPISRTYRKIIKEYQYL